MPGGGVVCGLCLHQSSWRGIKIAARDRTLREELLASFHDALIEIQVCLGLRHIQLRLLKIFGDLSLGLCLKGGLRRSVGAFVVQRGGLKVAVLKRCEQLACFDV